MKKTFTLLTFIIASVIAYAYPGEGRISITNLGSREVYVEIDGKRYADHSDNINVRSLTTGNHNLKVYRESARSGRNLLNSIGSKPQLVYSSTITVRSSYHIDVVVNRFGKVYIDELSMNDKNYDNDQSSNDDDRYNGGGNNGRYNDRDRDRYNNSRVMSDASFSNLFNQLKRERFDDGRLPVAKLAIDNNYFTTEQVKQLAQLFSFDDKKLDLAKYAYGKTVNKGDYYQVFEVFAYASSKEELTRYIKAYR